MSDLEGNLTEDMAAAQGWRWLLASCQDAVKGAWVCAGVRWFSLAEPRYTHRLFSREPPAGAEGDVG